MIFNYLFEKFLIKILYNFSYYDMPVDIVRKLINAIDNNKTDFNVSPFTPFISKKLRDLVGVQKPISEEKKSIEELHKNVDELKELLNNFIKNSNANNDIKDGINE